MKIVPGGESGEREPLDLVPVTHRGEALKQVHVGFLGGRRDQFTMVSASGLAIMRGTNCRSTITTSAPMSLIWRAPSRMIGLVGASGSSRKHRVGADLPKHQIGLRAALLRAARRFPGLPITVINRGVNGEEARDMLERFPRT